MKNHLRHQVLALPFFLLPLLACGKIYLDPNLYEQELPHATTGQYYEYCLDYQDNKNFVAFKFSDGVLPAGFSVNDTGCLMGTAQNAGVFDFAVTLTESVEATYFVEGECLFESECENDPGDDSQSEWHDGSTASDTTWFTLEVLQGGY